jgi:trimethylamine:corrinoid methyltransferase-like protein
VRRANSVAFTSPQFAVLSESELEDLHLAALEVLRRTGIRFHHQEALDMHRVAGAFVSDGNLVRFPSAMVEEAVSSTPGRIVMCEQWLAAGATTLGQRLNTRVREILKGHQPKLLPADRKHRIQEILAQVQ